MDDAGSAGGVGDPTEPSASGANRGNPQQPPSGPSRHNLRPRTWVTARNHRRITAPRTRTFNHGAALGPGAEAAAGSSSAHSRAWLCRLRP